MQVSARPGCLPKLNLVLANWNGTRENLSDLDHLEQQQNVCFEGKCQKILSEMAEAESELSQVPKNSSENCF